ncbi:MAG TPA: YtxH domain-containing protein, partial [Sandaracinaceae bacterium]
IIRTIAKTLGTMRKLGRTDLRSYVRGYLDQALESYGYSRRAGGVTGALPVVGAFGAGVAVGTGIGVLVAPRPGRETREMLGAKLRDFPERATREAGENGRSRIITDDPDIRHGRGPIGHG